MAVSKPVKVPERKITSIDVTDFSGGTNLNGEFSAKSNEITFGLNTISDEQGKLMQRYVLKRWLPSTTGNVYQVSANLYGGEIYYITADNGKIKYCTASSSAWTDCGGSNTFTAGAVTTFIRVLDRVLILNGVDKLAYVKLSDKTVVKFTALANPVSPPAVTAAGIATSGSFKIYYCTNFNSTVGQTAISPILSQTISKPRDMWKTDGSEYLNVARVNTPPAGATSWNLYASMSPAGGTIAASDMLLIAGGIDLSVTTFMDNGTLPIDLSRGTAPEYNSTDGPIAKYGTESEGRPILYGIKNDEYALLIGGDGDNAMDFSPNNGGYRAVLNKGTNYFPSSVIGFRNGQGIPSLTTLFSSTQGTSKQSILEQQTVTYGNYSFVVWAVTEQNYGAAGVSSPYAVVNYNGGLHFPTVNGFSTMDTEASLQNVLSIKQITGAVGEFVRSISTRSLGNIIGTAWDNKVYWTVPSAGNTVPNKILMYSMRDSGEIGAFHILDIAAQWIGVVSPNDTASFVYVCQGNSTYKLQEGYITADESASGVAVPFPVEAVGPFVSATPAHNSSMAVVQAVFYLEDFMGEVTIGVNYRNSSGTIVPKSKLVVGPTYSSSTNGNWSDVHILFNGTQPPLSWSDSTYSIGDDAIASQKISKRVPLPMNVISNEFQYFIKSDAGNNSWTLRSVSYEGQSIGVKGDLR